MPFLLFSPFPLVFSERCHPQDKKALLQLKKDLGNPYIITSWNAKEDCCDWYCCVECDEKTNRIISIGISSSIPDANASGQIPPSVGDLPYLESITFHKLPNLVGPIQPTIAKLTKLKSLFITYTNISGPIPAFLGQLKNLELIKLSFNNLSGPIPNCLISGPYSWTATSSRARSRAHLEPSRSPGQISSCLTTSFQGPSLLPLAT